MISDRLSKNSSSKEIFDNSKYEYEEALNKSGYKNTSLTYNIPKENTRPKRKRNIIWFNPPFSKGVTTNIGKIFLNLIDKHFPKSNKLNKIFNRNNVKVSYSCTENVKRIIKGHNKVIENPKITTTKPCNCHSKEVRAH